MPTRELPVAIQRYLRPDTYTWVVKLEDLNAEAFFRSEMDVTVPNVRLQPSTDVAESGTGEPIGELEIWDEANASIADGPTGEHTILLRGPASERLLTGAIRVEAQATGEGIEKVAFQLNGKPLLSKRRAPYSVEISLGTAPQLHSLVALALGADNRQLARDELLLNAGPNRFAVRLVEPQRGHRYSRSVRARAEVDLPSTEVLDRVDLFLNEDLVATLYQEPFVQPILIPEGQELGFVRAVAYLATGTSTEDLVFVNSPHPIANVDVNFVELYASIFDSRGRPVEDVDVSELRVLEDGEEQNVRRFTTVDERAIHAGILLDTSSSMEGSMEEAEDAALQFFESVVEDRDRACLINFADQPELVVPFTNDVSVLAGGLAGLVADGETDAPRQSHLRSSLLQRPAWEARPGAHLRRGGLVERVPVRGRSRIRATQRRGGLRGRPPDLEPGDRSSPEAVPSRERDRRAELLHRVREGASLRLREGRAGAALAVPHHLPVGVASAGGPLSRDRGQSEPQRRQGEDDARLLPMTGSSGTPHGGIARRVPSLVLASASPRRSELLSGLGIDFEVRPVDIDETPRDGEAAFDYVGRLAREKAAAAPAVSGELVLGADTIVVLDGNLLGKPRHESEARSMLASLSGRRHEVLTGVALRDVEGGRVEVGVDEAGVHFRRLSESELDWYCSTAEPYDKAGSYALQGLGALFVRHIDGAASNVIGLPLPLVYDLFGRLDLDLKELCSEPQTRRAS